MNANVYSTEYQFSGGMCRFKILDMMFILLNFEHNKKKKSNNNNNNNATQQETKKNRLLLASLIKLIIL